MEPGPGVVAEVRDCILRFYTSHDAREREEAERALAAFVKSDDSWRVTLHVLERDDATPVEGVFCAQTLHALIRRCVRKETRTQASHAAFTESDWVDLRARVLKLTAKFAMRSCAANAVDMRSALTKLSLSLAALGCKMNAWESDAVVRDVVEYFSNDASTTNEAKLLCLCTFLAFIPEEATSRDLSLHPQRRQDVLAALKASANDVMELLEQLAASAGADVMLHKYILDALSAWADVADVTAKFPRVILGGALQIVGTDGHQSSLKQSAANALKGALQQCVWTKNGELRETLAASMGSLRQAIAQPAVSVETKTLLSEVFSSIALTSLRNQKDATRNPLATGPDAAGDRVYVKHSEFKHLQRQQKKEQRKEQKLKTNIAVDIDQEVLVFSLDALSELLASGVSMASALEPWGKLAKSFIPEDFVAGSLRTVAARCMQAAVSYVCTQSRTDLEDDSQKEEFADCLRDVISTVSIENILGDFNESFHAELNAATEKGWKRIHARLYALLALTKSFQSGANQSSFTVLIETLSLLLVTDGVPVHVAESSCWVLAGLSKAIAALEDTSLLAVANVLIQSMTHVDFVVSRGAAVAMMKLSEHAAVRLRGTEVPSRLLRLHAQGGPTPSASLRLGQEHESTILLRSLTFYVACGDDANQAAESACVMLAQQAISALSLCVDVRRTNDYVKLLVDLDIVLRAMRRVCDHIGRPSDALIGLAKDAVHVVEKCASCTNEPVFVEERFKIGWALRALVELSEHMRRDGVLESVVAMSVEAYSRNPALGFCYLQALTISMERFGDQTCRVTMGGRAFESTGGIISELVAVALPGCLEDQESWSGVFALARAALRSGSPALIPHLATVTEASRRSLLSGCSDEPASVALSFATDLLSGGIMLRADLANGARAAREVSAKSMNSGLGRLAAEISGESNNRGSRWNDGGGGDALANALAGVMFVEGGSAAVALLRAVLEAGNGKMPPSMISDIAASLHLVWSTLGTEAFQRLLLLALGDEHDAFPKAKTTMEDKTLWVNSLTTDTARMDARVFKRLLKAFFGGKKVGSNL